MRGQSGPLAARIADGRLLMKLHAHEPVRLGPAGQRNEFVDYEPMLSLMECGKKRRAAKYRAYVEAGLDTADEDFLGELERSPRSIGNEKFREWVDGCYRNLLEQRGVQEDVSFRQTGRHLAIELILKTMAKQAGIGQGYLKERRRDATWRAVASWMLCKYGGRTQRQVAAILGAKTGVAISCQLNMLKRKLADPTLPGVKC